MNARESIMAAIRDAKPADVARPDVRSVVARFPQPADLKETFAGSVALAGARFIEGPRSELPRLIAAAYPDWGRRVSVMEASDAADEERSPHSFADTDVFICEATLAVAENGAVWLPLSRLRHRSAVFLATNVIIVVDRACIVADLHEGYASLDVASDGFGVFVAGPSKTADIEQALVIGAHGPTSLTIVLVDGAG
jgi:L-lactate dehydrogenase complex protein LldG